MIKGKIIIVGGGIDTGDVIPDETLETNDTFEYFFKNGILKKILTESKKGIDSRIEIITTASRVAIDSATPYIRAFKLLGAKNVHHLHLYSRLDSKNPDFVKRLKEADVAFFTGGDQLRLTSTIGGTIFQQVLLEKFYHEDFLYVGTSAGAAAVSVGMIYEGESSLALRKGTVELNGGLGLIDSIIVDTHFLERGRIGRLFQTVVGNPMKIGIGLGENTGLLITEDNNKLQAIGTGNLIIVDGHNITDTNLTQIPIGKPISISNITVHCMTENDIYYIKENKLIIKDSQY